MTADGCVPCCHSLACSLAGLGQVKVAKGDSRRLSTEEQKTCEKDGKPVSPNDQHRPRSRLWHMTDKIVGCRKMFYD